MAVISIPVTFSLEELAILVFPLFFRRSMLEPSLLVHFFPVVFLPFSSVFQNQRIYFFNYLDSIFAILTFQDTRTGLYSSGKTPKTCALSSSSFFSYFALIFLNLRFRLYSSLNQISGSRMVSLIFQLLNLFVT